MKNILSDMPLFVEVARQKSFTRAADILDMPVSTLSRRIAGMEKQLGVPLLLRNSRNVELTESGSLFLEHCEYLVTGATDACEAITRNMNAPAGTVRFSVSFDAYGLLKEGLNSFATKWPKIQLDIRFSDRATDLLTEPFDLEMKLGPLADSALKSRLMTSVPHAIYGSPELIKRCSPIRHPADLKNIPCVIHQAEGSQWTLQKGNETLSVRVTSTHLFNNIQACLDFALAGHGMACLASPLALPHLKTGKLVRILPDWNLPKADIYLLMANSQVPLRVRLFIDHLIEHARKLAQDYERQIST